MSLPDTKHLSSNTFKIKVSGVQDKVCRRAVDKALRIMRNKLPSSALRVITGTEVIIASNLIESGGLARAEEKKIILDTAKNALSLQSAESFLVGAGYLEAGDWTNALLNSKDQPWSCLTYQLVHEFGHLIDGLSRGTPYERLAPRFSPTKYGATSSSESFAEAFAYWAFGLNISSEAQRAVSGALSLDA